MNSLNKRNKLKIFVAVTISVVVILIAICGIYVSDYYRADDQAMFAYATVNDLTVDEKESGIIVCSPENATTGLIFYPGGKVEYSAYAPLMKACADRGILCVLVEMPFNLAVLDVNAADGIQQQYPYIENWYIGGHSLGGSMAASYLAENASDYQGLILLASYSTADLSDISLNVLSVYGTEDGVMNRENYAEYKTNLPVDFTEFVIDGGCHSYFGMYGMQDGDGVPTIGNEEQINQTADAIADFIQN